MNLKPCKACGQMISSNIWKCPICGYNYKRSHFFIAGLLTIILLIFMFSYLHNKTANKNIQYNQDNSVSSVELSQEQINYLHKLQKQGMISINYESNRVNVNPNLWNSMDAKLKEDFSASLAIYCGTTKGTGLNWVEIYDKQSGKKLAKYSKNWGFTIY